MQSSQAPFAGRFPRRALLVGAGATTLVAIAGCTAGGTAAVTRTVVTTAAPPTDPMVTLIYTTQLDLSRLDAGIKADKRDAAKLTPLRNDRAAQLAALVKELGRTDPSAAKSVSAAIAHPSGVTMSGDPDAVLAEIRGDAATAQGQFIDAVPIVSRYRAGLLGSIAACLASHRAVLA